MGVYYQVGRWTPMWLRLQGHRRAEQIGPLEFEWALEQKRSGKTVHIAWTSRSSKNYGKKSLGQTQLQLTIIGTMQTY